MKNSNTITIIEDFLKRDEIEKSLEVLLDFFEKLKERDYKNQAIQLLGRFKSNAREYNIGVLNNDEYNIVLSKIRNSIIELKDNLTHCADGELVKSVDKSRFERIEKYIEKTKQGNWVSTTFFELAANTIGVEFHESSEEENTEGVIIDLTKYESLADVLDDLYICYLTGKYKPMTYGSSWVLVKILQREGTILVPSNWIDFDSKIDFKLSHEWAYRSPIEVGIQERTRWKIVPVESLKEYLVLCINDDILIDALSHPKALYILKDVGIIKYGKHNDIDKSQFKKVIPIILDGRYFYDAISNGENIIYQAITPLPDDEHLYRRLLRWKRY